MSLSSLRLMTSYHKGINDIAAEFYLPCMNMAISYDRAVGFFSSTVYTIAWSALKDFVRRGGKMRIICSPVLSDEDIKALEEGYNARVEEDVTARLAEEVKHLLGNPSLQEPAKVLASLVALEVIELRVAFINTYNVIDRKRLFHDKLGIFRDLAGNSVVFKGSMNETWYGLANDGNLESVDVFLSWEGDRELSRVETETTYFGLLWDNQYPSVKVKPFPDVARQELVKVANTEQWEKLVDDIVAEVEKTGQVQKISPANTYLSTRTPRPHQSQALAEWEKNGRRGILKHITGSGKTFTALIAIREALAKGEVILILVPSEYLLFQWNREVQEALGDLEPNILLCGGGNSDWNSKNLLSPWTRVKTAAKPRIVLSTLQTASLPNFMQQVRQGEHLFLVVDEVHRIGSPKYSQLLRLNTGPRLGLSGTPERAGDPVGTKLIFDYFQGIVAPPFTLREAIPTVLTPYFYYVHPVSLSQHEQEEWTEISKKISRLCAQAKTNASSGSRDTFTADRVKLLLIQRARIVKSAANKVAKTVEVMTANFEPGHLWILYCDTLAQVNTIVSTLRAQGLPAVEYHSTMTGDRNQTIKLFESNGGILVSIHCLDEGVDIPAVTHALILASSQNPREFIQRRGRVLRKSENKLISYVHDLVVMPIPSEEKDQNLSIIETEIARAIEFGTYAQNPSSITELQRIALKFGMDYTNLVDGGFEDDDD